MIKQMCFVSYNQNKKKEIETFMKSAGIEISIYLHTDILNRQLKIVEDGENFYENAMIKVKSCIDISYDIPVFGEDSGLCIKSLNYRPGIYSARYGGKDLSYVEKCELILKELEGKKDRTAYFISVIAIAYKGKIFCVEGRSYGEIAYDIKEGFGFGYDPIFISKDGRRFSELKKEEKNEISHRGKSLKKLILTMKRIGLL
jgi:XTP/dITP diphosphohydrolase